MSTRKWVATVVSLVMVVTLVLAGCGGGKDAAKKDEGKTYKWRIGYHTVPGSVRDLSAKEFKRVVEEKSKGRVKVELFPGSSLGNEQEMIEMVKAGGLDFSLPGGGALQNLVKEYAVLTLPFMFSNYDEAHAVLDSQTGDRLKKMAEQHNLKVLSFCDLGFAQITNNKRPIKTPDDLAGLKIRSPKEPSSIATFKALGAAVSTMPFSEVYMALSQKVVDGQFNPLDAIYDTKFYEVQDHLAITNHFFYNYEFMMSKKLYDSLDPELQKIVQEAANAAMEVSRKFYKEKDAEMLTKLKPHFKEITNPDLAAFRNKLNPLYDTEFKDIVPKATVDEVKAFVENYRKTKK